MFARCLTEKKFEFYGASWCTHCTAEKELFGSSFQYINYIECATPDGKNQTQECADANIAGYPTYVFADGTRLSGETPLSNLAVKTGCALPN